MKTGLSNSTLKKHFYPQKGWINDPNGLCFFNGYYHIFYQFCPNNETPFNEPVVWGHAITKDFVSYKELPIAINIGKDGSYDNGGVWSGTAVVKNGTLYLFYTSLKTTKQSDKEIKKQSICLAFSKDGTNFTKYCGNPIIESAPNKDFEDFRDPSICLGKDGKNYLFVASGDREKSLGLIFQYESDDLLNWNFKTIITQIENSFYCECPSFVHFDNENYLFSYSYLTKDYKEYLDVFVGNLSKDKFNIKYKNDFMYGPDQYAGQFFNDEQGRCIFITWIPGWEYREDEKCIGCMSTPLEITVKNDKICAYPVEELRYLLKDKDETVEICDNGFIVRRIKKPNFSYNGGFNQIEIIRDDYILEIFINKGEKVFTIILC